MTEKIFKEIDEQCKSWIETKEEIYLKNQLKWLGMKVKGDERYVPKVVKIDNKGLISIIPIWSEIPTTAISGERKKMNLQKEKPST